MKKLPRNLRPSILDLQPRGWGRFNLFSKAEARDMGIPKIRDTFLGFPIYRTIVFWGLYWGPPIFGNYHLIVIRVLFMIVIVVLVMIVTIVLVMRAINSS